MKLDKNYRLDKTTKRMMAMMPSHKANSYKKLIIQADLLGSVIPRPKKFKEQKDNEAE